MANGDGKLRQLVIELLNGGQAHVNFEKAIARFPPGLRGTRPKGAAHSAWELIEHIRIAQIDIVSFTRNPKYQSPPWPSGYWPKTAAPPSAKAWNQCCAAIKKDRLAMEVIVSNEDIDLLAPLPHDPTKTALREAMVLADHNAYHLGELVTLRRLLGCWD